MHSPTLRVTTVLLNIFRWVVLYHPPHSPSLALSDFHLFLNLKRHMVGKMFDDGDEIKEEITMWFKGLVEDFYNSGIQKQT